MALILLVLWLLIVLNFLWFIVVGKLSSMTLVKSLSLLPVLYAAAIAYALSKSSFKNRVVGAIVLTAMFVSAWVLWLGFYIISFNNSQNIIHRCIDLLFGEAGHIIAFSLAAGFLTSWFISKRRG